jgi:hypothetical protein
MAGSTGAGTAAFRHDAVNIVVDCTFHHRVAVLNVDLVSFTVWRDVNYFGHILQDLKSKKRAPTAPALLKCHE